jgi:hypothetical protein
MKNKEPIKGNINFKLNPAQTPHALVKLIISIAHIYIATGATSFFRFGLSSLRITHPYETYGIKNKKNQLGTTLKYIIGFRKAIINTITISTLNNIAHLKNQFIFITNSLDLNSEA